jgi:alkanesulfonate monooxygenase SsuD/methylene tetrahydromethanopterin reductase-like flavin-dependent oxidoreductase (luciferase family)
MNARNPNERAGQLPMPGTPGSRPISIGYLLPTRELVMSGRPAAGELLRLAARAEALGFDSLWAGDSLLARPRHDPLTLLAAVAVRTTRPLLGTAILMPVLRNPVVLAQQVATVDQLSEGRFVLGVGIGAENPAVRAEFTAAGVPFEQRLGRTLEGLRLCRALWSGNPVSWSGRWTLTEQTLGPLPHRPGGPPIWMASMVPAGLERTGRLFDGWLPLGPDDPTVYRDRWNAVQASAAAAGRAGAVTGAMYLTVSLHDDPAEADRRLNGYLASYYAPAPAATMRALQACYAGPPEGLARWLSNYADAGAAHLVLRFAGDHDRHLETVAEVWSALRVDQR